ncbi:MULTISPECIES: ABC transporter ATP-binding protein [Cyanophyceae]|uniref:ABC transporter ATP-binding protein n=1 Tax=Cyanophyceae TaxID=3028117 RepID=UPI001F54AD21|nr:ABC transporter ATP-binding protein [Trichocoleus sp. FACHB-69]
MQTPVVEMRGITKKFPGIVANDSVNFELQSGEIHALLGENGAGKTTLMNILCGLYEPDEGEILLEGKSVQFRFPGEAIASGIGMVHQHFMLVESLTVADNLVLGQARQPLIRENPKKLHQRLRNLAEQYGLQIDPAAEVWQLSLGEQQRVEILKAIYRGAKVLILDEPTAVLAPQEVEGFLQTLRNLAAGGTSIIFISHKLNEVLAICDRVTVLRDGRTITTVLTSASNERELAHLMVGREVNKVIRIERQAQSPIPNPQSPIPNPPLIIRDLWVENDRGLPALKGINLAVNAGEIVGIAGVDGNGQRELEEAIASLRPIRGEINLNGTLAHIPSDRYTMGLIPDFSVADNLVLRDIQKPPFNKKGLLRPAAIVRHCTQLVERYLIRTPSPHTHVGKLSGGNAQKVAIARELSRSPQIVLAAQPTRGLDISAIEYVHQQLIAQRDAGAAVLLISTELEEILNLSDRIAVLYEGAIAGIVDANADVRHLGLMMAGKH